MKGLNMNELKSPDDSRRESIDVALLRERERRSQLTQEKEKSREKWENNAKKRMEKAKVKRRHLKRYKTHTTSKTERPNKQHKGHSSTLGGLNPEAAMSQAIPEEDESDANRGEEKDPDKQRKLKQKQTLRIVVGNPPSENESYSVIEPPPRNTTEKSHFENGAKIVTTIETKTPPVAATGDSNTNSNSHVNANVKVNDNGKDFNTNTNTNTNINTNTNTNTNINNHNQVEESRSSVPSSAIVPVQSIDGHETENLAELLHVAYCKGNKQANAHTHTHIQYNIKTNKTKKATPSVAISPQQAKMATEETHASSSSLQSSPVHSKSQESHIQVIVTEKEKEIDKVREETNHIMPLSAIDDDVDQSPPTDSESNGI
ncbi:hypothetical protein RFI_30672, partial [Reticulomyxa filosa]